MRPDPRDAVPKIGTAPPPGPFANGLALADVPISVGKVTALATRWDRCGLAPGSLFLSSRLPKAAKSERERSQSGAWDALSKVRRIELLCERGAGEPHHRYRGIRAMTAEDAGISLAAARRVV